MPQSKMSHPRERWASEMTSAWLYERLAGIEENPARARLFQSLAGTAREQAGILEKDIPGGPGAFHPAFRARVVAFLLQFFRPVRMLGVLSAMKVRGLSTYRGHMAPHGRPAAPPFREARHRGFGGGTLRAGVFGVNDGLVSNTSLILGVAGATQDPAFILVSGLAGLLAGAFSMAAGEYISVRSQREMYHHQISQEAEEIARYPKAEARELALIYAARGVAKPEAARIAEQILKDPGQALDVLAREELGLNPEDLGSPIGAMTSSFIAFAIGASLPLVPYLVGLERYGVLPSVAIAGVALFAVGAAISLFSGKNGLYGGARMLLIGGVAAFATYHIGKLLGVAMS
jgi:vacuolar iron transporter family protein